MRVRDNSYANVYPEYGIPSDVCGTMSEKEKARRRTARAKKAKNEKIFHDNYDPSISVDKNLEILQGLGIKASRSKIYRLVKEYYPKPIQKTPDEKNHYMKSKNERAKRQAKRDARKANDDIFWNNYNPKLSVKDNLKILKDLGMKISKTKLYELIKKYNNDAEIFEERMANRN